VEPVTESVCADKDRVGAAALIVYFGPQRQAPYRPLGEDRSGNPRTDIDTVCDVHATSCRLLLLVGGQNGSSKQPNILILWGDDIGWWNISYNNRGQMGYRTPNIDRIGHEGELHRLLWSTELHCRPSGVYYWAKPDPHRLD
jgi:hypothetical protein